jgi:uncharacterized membrane protein YfcA
MTPAFIIVVAFLTAFLSGIFGMAGGLILMGALALVLPVSAAFVTHGVLQLVANGWRAVVHREHVVLGVLGRYAAASALAGLLVALVGFAPSRPLLFLMLGLVPMLVWVPRRWLDLDANRPAHALVAGFLVTGLNLTAGVAGPLLDIFFVRTALDRHQIVSTKAAANSFSHLAKIAVFGAPMLAQGARALPPWWTFAAAVPLSMAGTLLGGRVLDRLSDHHFRQATRAIVTAIGLLYLAKAWDAWA